MMSLANLAVGGWLWLTWSLFLLLLPALILGTRASPPYRELSKEDKEASEAGDCKYAALLAISIAVTLWCMTP